MKNTLAPLAVLAGATTLTAADLEISFEKYKLENGLRVILAPDHSAPVVAVYVIYDVGARAEEKGRTGFAHLFEHMMFQGSKNAPKGMHFQTVESNGGNLNGSTHADFTDYFEVLPSNKLPVALWLESDRMRGLNITDENLTNQKEAVKQERRLSFDNRAYATAIIDVWPTVFFQNWSNNHSLIGSFEDLNAATVDDVAKFFKTYYAPNNAVLVIVGDIQPAEARKWISTYFADIPSQPRPKRPDLTEPEKKATKWETYPDKLAKVPAVVIGYPGPKRRSADYYAMVMLDVLLTAGASSRFNQNLVKGKESVVQYEANLGWPLAGPNDYVDPAPYGMAFFHKPNFTAKQIVEQAEAEIARVKTEGVPPAELNRIRTFLRSNSIREVRTVLRRAMLLGQFEVFDGDPGLINTELSRFLAVAGEQIQAAAKKYCDPAKRSVLEIVPAPAKQKETGQ
jgi:predicted Zn-dependent peptidase